MPCKLRIRDDLSITDIMQLARNHLVKVTPHVGNWTPARLVLPTLGVSILCVDHTIGIKDRNTHPHLFIRDGEVQLLCHTGDRLTTHSRVTESSRCGTYAVGTSLSQVHVGAVRSLYPSAHIVTHTEHLQTDRETVLAVLEEVSRVSMTASWWRRVDTEGVVTNYQRKNLPKSWWEVAQNIYSVTNQSEGWLIHNRVAILMDIIQQSRHGEEPEIFHLSGPDMVRYLGGELEVISRMYDSVRKRLGLRQEIITFNIVPFASFRFASRTSQSSACVELCNALERGDDDTVLRSFVREAFDVLADSETQNYLTQHDCLATGERIVVPDSARDWSMKTCADHMTRLRALA